jgi:hypothetical protein
MPQSRNRPGHKYQKPADIPARQRTKGHIILAILFAVFAVIVALFAAGPDYIILALAAIAGAAVGYLVGRSMEKDASH